MALACSECPCPASHPASRPQWTAWPQRLRRRQRPAERERSGWVQWRGGRPGRASAGAGAGGEVRKQEDVRSSSIFTRARSDAGRSCDGRWLRARRQQRRVSGEGSITWAWFAAAMAASASIALILRSTASFCARIFRSSCEHQRHGHAVRERRWVASRFLPPQKKMNRNQVFHRLYRGIGPGIARESTELICESGALR